MSEHTPENARAGHAVSDLPATLRSVRTYLWGELCRDDLTASADHPTAVLYRDVVAALKKAGAEG